MLFNTAHSISLNFPFMVTKRTNVHESMIPVLAYVRAKEINEAKFSAELGIDHGRFTNWKRRGVPQRMHRTIAAKIGMTTDQYFAEIGLPTGPGAPHRPIEEAIAFDRLRKALPDWRNYVLGLAMVSSHEAQALLLSTMRNAVPDAHVGEFISAAPTAEDKK